MLVKEGEQKKEKDPKKTHAVFTPMTSRLTVLFICLLGSSFVLTQAFVGFHRSYLKRTGHRLNNMSSSQDHPFCSLPGDPSLMLTTNVDLGDKKLDIIKGE
jgi:hypothetical protein